MQVLGRTFILAVCLLGAYAWPNRDHNVPEADSVYQLLLSQVRTAFFERALSPGESACSNYYNNQTQTINNLLANQTNACFEKANSTTWANNNNTNATVNIMRQNLTTVQENLRKCNALTLVPQFLDCLTSTYDANLIILDSLNSKAYGVQAQIAANQTQVDVVRQACISSAIGSAKANLTIAANDYNTCLQNVAYQRDTQPTQLLN